MNSNRDTIFNLGQHHLTGEDTNEVAFTTQAFTTRGSGPVFFDPNAESPSRCDLVQSGGDDFLFCTVSSGEAADFYSCEGNRIYLDGINLISRTDNVERCTILQLFAKTEAVSGG